MVKKTVTKSIKTLVNSALGGVWRNQLLKNSVLRVEGLLGVTLSNKEVLLVHVDELLSDQALLLLQTDDEDSDVAAPVGEPIKARVKSPAKRGRKRKYPQSKKEEIPSVQPTSLVDNFVVLQADSGQPVQNFPLDIYSEANPVLDEATQDDDLDHVDQVISVKEERHDMSYGEPDTGHDDGELENNMKMDVYGETEDGEDVHVSGVKTEEVFPVHALPAVYHSLGSCETNRVDVNNQGPTFNSRYVKVSGKNSVKCKRRSGNYYRRKALVLPSQSKVCYQNMYEAYCCPQCDQEFALLKDFRSHAVLCRGEQADQHSLKIVKCEEDANLGPAPVCSPTPPHDETTCDKCSRKFTSRPSLLQHLLICGKVDKKYPCQYCDKKFVALRYMRDHENRTHNAKRSTVCEVCGQKLAPYSLERHLWLVHQVVSEDSSYPESCVCELCGLTLKSKDTLVRHLKNLHKVVRPVNRKGRSTRDLDRNLSHTNT